MKIIYIAGPLTTGGDGSRECVARNVQHAEKYQIALANVGVGFFCPHTHTSSHREKGSIAPEQFYYELGLDFLKRVTDGVLAVPGWEKSRGARMEVEWAISNGLKVFYPQSPDELLEIIEWAKE